MRTPDCCRCRLAGSAPWLGILLAAFLHCGCTGDRVQTYSEITVQELHTLTQEQPDLVLIDTRELREYLAVRARPVKRLIPHSHIIDSVHVLPGDLDTPIYLICRVGLRSGIAAKDLIAYGYTAVYNVKGGTRAWLAAGLPADSGAGQSLTSGL
jgi:rhodanese-related sulfurtransferase